jgi:succinate dehydrogenase / fumarate reductase membrane anchor subunit
MTQLDSASMKTPLARARGYGSARSGTQHFWHQRLTSVANIPLTIAFIVIVISLLGRNHAAAVQILGSPLVAVVMLLFILTNVYHMCLGMQEIIVDYVHDELLKYAALMANTFFGFVIALASAYAILKLSFGV